MCSITLRMFHLASNKINTLVHGHKLNPKTRNEKKKQSLRRNQVLEIQAVYHTLLDLWTRVEVTDKAFFQCCKICRSETCWLNPFTESLKHAELQRANMITAFDRNNLFLCVDPQNHFRLPTYARAFVAAQILVPEAWPQICIISLLYVPAKPLYAVDFGYNNRPI